MRKTDKKIENALRHGLTEVCEVALQDHQGFVWLTHFVDYRKFPDSLAIVCIFDTNEQLEKADKNSLQAAIREKLRSLDVNLKDIRQNVSFDTEENCEKENDGNWSERFG